VKQNFRFAVSQRAQILLTSSQSVHEPAADRRSTDPQTSARHRHRCPNDGAILYALLARGALAPVVTRS